MSAVVIKCVCHWCLYCVCVWVCILVRIGFCGAIYAMLFTIEIRGRIGQITTTAAATTKSHPKEKNENKNCTQRKDASDTTMENERTHARPCVCARMQSIRISSSIRLSSYRCNQWCLVRRRNIQLLVLASQLLFCHWWSCDCCFCCSITNGRWLVDLSALFLHLTVTVIIIIMANTTG